MNNDSDQSVIDYILQLDPATQQEQYTSSQPMASTTNDMTKSDLFEYYLGEHVKDNDNANQQRQTKRSAQVVDDDDKSTVTSTSGKRTKKSNAAGEGAKALSGRLDFRPTMTDQVPESQLKSMSPRERRQLRNKISARNFRNRRKEYMSTLEEELDECKTENSKLHSELSTMQEKISQLENENKQLRLELVLYEQGINPAVKSSSPSLAPNTDQLQIYQHNTALPLSTTDSTSAIELSPATLHGFSSDSSSASPPDLSLLHDFTTALAHPQPFYFDQPQQQQQQQQQQMTSVWNLSAADFNLHDMFLSHAMMPNWDVNRMLSKANEQSPLHTINVMDTFRRYPLLAPALMSIVVGHTMTLSTDDLVTLNLPTTATNDHDKRNLKIWELLQPLGRKSITGTEEEEDEYHDTTEGNDETTDNHQQRCIATCIVGAFHRYLKTYVCASVHTYMEYCCRQQQMAEEKQEESNLSGNTNATPEPKYATPFCKRLRRAKELFIPVA